MNICLIIPSFYPAIVYGGPIFSTWYACKYVSGNEISIFVSTTNANGLEKLPVERNNFIKYGEEFYVKYYNETIIGRFSLSMIFGLWKDIK